MRVERPFLLQLVFRTHFGQIGVEGPGPTHPIAQSRELLLPERRGRAQAPRPLPRPIKERAGRRGAVQPLADALCDPPQRRDGG